MPRYGTVSLFSCEAQAAGGRLAFLLFGFVHYAALFDTGFLAGKATEIVKLGTTYFTVFVYRDGIDERRFDREDTLNADVVGHFADGETFFGAFAVDADHNAAVLLDTFLVTFLDAVGYGDGVAGAEFGVPYSQLTSAK